ncbi:MAG: hypothetical protein IPJ27_02370 [Candidatus Accumulibacter sp.]|uniref:Uncharacterized protein n=1 Tax=Candidatus Accumulibacter proximus TaxID=2954385 RepID=A0A935UFI9_9PROT|nr:hypothetical protein [Candidatus Accumulibacter proximus]
MTCADIRSEISRTDPLVLGEMNPDDFVKLGDSNAQPAPYKSVSLPLLDAHRRLRARNALTAAQYLRYLTAILLDRFSLDDSRVTLPDSVKGLYPRELVRIRAQLGCCDASFYDFDVDPFAKDFALLTHRFIPIGAEFVEPDATVPRRPLFATGMSSAVSAAWLMLVRSWRLQTVLLSACSPAALHDFNPEGWRDSYHRLADLLAANPRVRGVTSASWFLDPNLPAISPHLAYLRDVPEQAGAKFFFSAFDSHGESGALAKSATRRVLFEQARYLPAVYLRVWLRGDVLAWSRANQGREGEGFFQ